jgi:glycosyltransferase involved in cell wall biosynthesis
MRLGFDATSLTKSGKGVARFQREVLRAAAAHDLVEELDVFVPLEPDEEALPMRDGWRYHRVRTSPMIAWEQLWRPALARRLGLDAVLTTSERAALWGPREVAYVYEHPRYRARRGREVGSGWRQRLVDDVTLALFGLARRRATVVAASRSTARDVGTTAVVYSGVSEEFAPGERPRTYFLHIASDDPRDNSTVVVDAYAQLGPDAPPLVVAGPIAVERPALESRARAVGATVDWRGFQSGSALVALYRGAIAYVDPSLYEGFGLQAAEALACGTPVIASNVTSLPEVVGDAGILLDPHDVEGFARAMTSVASDAALAAELGARAIRQAARFRWEETARELIAICRDATTLGTR